MARTTDGPLLPRNGHTLRVGRVARISGCDNQKEVSLEDQLAHYTDVVSNLFDGPVEYVDFATIGKGENLERPELADIRFALSSGTLDLLIVEDLGRLVRGAEAVRLLGIGVDHGVRCIAPDDGVDTSEVTWERDALNAAAEHVAHNTHASTRLKQKMMRRFKAFGGAMSRPIFGYIVPDEAETFDAWRKDPVAAVAIKEGLLLLRETLNCSAVADMFNAQGIPVGPYARNDKWDGNMVRRFYRNPLLMGQARRGMMHSVKHFESGRRRSVKSKKEPESYHCPHLAYLTPEEFYEINAQLDEKNKNIGRKAENGADPLLNVPRKRTRFPGQWSRCWYCGRHHVWGGNGITKNLMCSASRHWECWNSVGFDGSLAAQKIVKLIMGELNSLQGIDDAYRDVVERARAQQGGIIGSMEWTKLLAEEQRLTKEQKNISDGIAACGPEPFLISRLKETKVALELVSRQRNILEALKARPLELPTSSMELRTMVEATLSNLAIESPSCSYILRKLVPSFHVYLVRACDGGHLLPRAKVQIALDGIIPDAQHAADYSQMLRREFTMDLFEPAQRVRILEDAVRLNEMNLSYGEIANLIPEKPTTTAVQNALILSSKMKELGLQNPYTLVVEPPMDYAKLRRHLNAKYQFIPVPGYIRPSI